MRITDKIEDIEKYLSELKEIIPSDLESYKSSIEKKAACERYVEKIMEAVTDIAFRIIRIKKFETPQDDSHAFDILANHKIIDNELAIKLKQAKGMKNVISHQYGRIDDEIVFESITTELSDDAEAFINKIRKINLN